jgi:hypothetical protein
MIFTSVKFKRFLQATVLILALWSLGSVLVPTAVYADDPTGRTGLVQCGNSVGDPCTVEDIFNIFVIGTNLLIGAGGLVTILAIVFSGFSMVMAAGNTESITHAKKKLTNAITGLVLVLLAFILINVILYGILGVTGNKEGVFNPIEYITGGSGIAPSNAPKNGP